MVWTTLPLYLTVIMLSDTDAFIFLSGELIWAILV
jgi:hypothetical protein